MNQAEHWDYTTKEWQQREFADILTVAGDMNPKVIYDIGACVGGWAHLALQKFKPDHLYAFEPYIPNFEALQKNLTGNVTLYNTGIFYGIESGKSYWGGDNVGGIFVRNENLTGGDYTGHDFALTTLEKVIAEGAKMPDLIKMDVEGSEKNIIENSSVIKEVPQLIIEWHYARAMSAIDLFGKYLPHHVVRCIDDTQYLLQL